MISLFEIVRIERAPEGPLLRLGRAVLGLFLIAFGLFLLLVFTYAMLIEVMRGTIFGLGICILVTTCGALLARAGLAQLTCLKIRLKPNP